MKTRLNLATRPFPRYRTTNLVLAGVLIGSLGLGVWLVAEYFLDPPALGPLQQTEAELREHWEDLGLSIAEIEVRLQAPESTSQMSELIFLSQIMTRKQFSWSVMLREIEQVIPTTVQLVGLIPDIGEGGRVFVQMEARGRSIAGLSEFIANLELTDAFRDVRVVEREETVVDGLREERVVMGADYVGAALTEVVNTGE